MIVTENKHEKKFNDARIALILDLLRHYYGPSIPLYQYPVYGTQGNPVILDLLVNRFLLDWRLFQYLSGLFSDFIILVIWLNKFIHNVFRYCGCVLPCACCVSPTYLMTSSLINIFPTSFRRHPSPLRRLPTTPEPCSKIFPISPNNGSKYPLDQSEGSKQNRPPI